jgi:hypothetical protein
MERKARTNPAQLYGLENKKKSGRRRSIFLDFPFYRTYQELRVIVAIRACVTSLRTSIFLDSRCGDWQLLPTSPITNRFLGDVFPREYPQFG